MSRVVTLGEVREAARGFLILPSLRGAEDPEFFEDCRILREVGMAVCKEMHLPPELGVFLPPETVLSGPAMYTFLEWEERTGD